MHALTALHHLDMAAGDGKNKDMGGLLTTGGLDFLIISTGAKLCHACAVSCNLTLRMSGLSYIGHAIDLL